MVRRAPIRCGDHEMQLRGVSKMPRRKYAAAISDPAKQSGGTFNTAEAAARASDTSARQFHGREAKTNSHPPDLEVKTAGDFNFTGNIRSPSWRNNAEPAAAIPDSELLDLRFPLTDDLPLGLKLSYESTLKILRAVTEMQRVNDFRSCGMAESESDSSSTVVDQPGSPLSGDIDLELKLAPPTSAAVSRHLFVLVPKSSSEDFRCTTKNTIPIGTFGSETSTIQP